jgi:hypothetical protein
MAPSVSELLVKAVRGLPQEEQDAILGGLLYRGTGVQPAGIAAGRGPWGHLAPDPSLLAGSPRLGERGSQLRVVPVRLSVEQHEALKRWCEANDFSMATVIRGLVDRFLTTQTRPED